MKHTVNRKDYHAFLQSCVDKCYKGEMTWKEYREMEIELEHIDFTPYPTITKEHRSWIETLFNGEDEDGTLRGFTRREIAEMKLLDMSYGDYATAYSFFGYNDTEMMLYTYCEGDTTLKMYSTREEYEKAKKDMVVWYGKEYA